MMMFGSVNSEQRHNRIQSNKTVFVPEEQFQRQHDFLTAQSNIYKKDININSTERISESGRSLMAMFRHFCRQLSVFLFSRVQVSS